MEDMPKHPRLVKRGNVYWHRASVPADLKATYPKSEETLSLKSKDPMEAVRLVRKAAADVDRRFEAHRRSLAATGTSVSELNTRQLEELERVYLQFRLEEMRKPGLTVSRSTAGQCLSTRSKLLKSMKKPPLILSGMPDTSMPED